MKTRPAARPARSEDGGSKRPFEVDRAIELLREAVRPLPPAVMYQLADEGFGSPFEQLVACIISIRTLEETTLPVARALFARARTPAELARLSVAEITALIRPSTFHEGKASRLREIAELLLAEHDGELPCDERLLLSLPGVGPKCANLVLAIGCGVPRIGVDIHVHRVTNRWGIVQASTPEQTLSALEAVLPERYWIELNRLLVPFGKYICTGRAPRCSSCPLLEMCQQRNVGAHR
jgi:endonuclease III